MNLNYIVIAIFFIVVIVIWYIKDERKTNAINTLSLDPIVRLIGNLPPFDNKLSIDFKDNLKGLAKMYVNAYQMACFYGIILMNYDTETAHDIKNSLSHHLKNHDEHFYNVLTELLEIIASVPNDEDGNQSLLGYYTTLARYFLIYSGPYKTSVDDIKENGLPDFGLNDTFLATCLMNSRDETIEFLLSYIKDVKSNKIKKYDSLKKKEDNSEVVNT